MSLEEKCWKIIPLHPCLLIDSTFKSLGLKLIKGKPVILKKEKSSNQKKYFYSNEKKHNRVGFSVNVNKCGPMLTYCYI